MRLSLFRGSCLLAAAAAPPLIGAWRAAGVARRRRGVGLLALLVGGGGAPYLGAARDAGRLAAGAERGRSQLNAVLLFLHRKLGPGAPGVARATRCIRHPNRRVYRVKQGYCLFLPGMGWIILGLTFSLPRSKNVSGFNRIEKGQSEQ